MLEESDQRKLKNYVSVGVVRVRGIRIEIVENNSRIMQKAEEPENQRGKWGGLSRLCQIGSQAEERKRLGTVPTGVHENT